MLHSLNIPTRNAWVFFLAVPAALAAQPASRDTAVRVTFGGFADGYYAWDVGRPGTFDRSFAGGALFTTQPARHNEFNINLAFVEARLEGARVRGRLALQAGTSVQSNYSGEPTTGAVSDPSLSRHIQEAVVGYQLGPAVWVDGGIFYSHMGMESWASRDNLTYTRSLVAEYSPYYQSGAKITWAATPRLTAQLDLVNGWQNISENNSGKGVGARFDWTATPNASVSYYNFLSQEAGTRLRFFNGIGGKLLAGATTWLAQLDVGTQDHSSATGGSATWSGVTAVGRLRLSPSTSLVARVERFDDENEVVIATGALGGTANGPFRGSGASLGIDVSPEPRLLWRTELRGFRNRTAIFPDGRTGAPRKGDGFAVTSLGVTF
jgi:hypothetical protein